jgi:membrane protein DedA with SNARE-associated domain
MRWIGPILAGMHQVSWKKFLKVDIAALFVYVPLMLWLGAYFHNRIDQLIEGVYVVRNIAGIVIMIIVGGSILWATKHHMVRHLKKILATSESKETK